MLNVIWPTKRNTEPSSLTSLGRVLLWMALLSALLFLMLAVSSFVQSTKPGGNDYWDSQSFNVSVGMLFVGIALSTYGAGRIARRLLSKE